VDRARGKGMGGKEKNGKTGEGMERKGRMYCRLCPLLQEFLWVSMIPQELSSDEF